MTTQGREVVTIARRMLDDARNMQRGERRSVAAGGCANFSIATTHTQARYTLPPVIRNSWRSSAREAESAAGHPGRSAVNSWLRRADIGI